jgi:lysozyme
MSEKLINRLVGASGASGAGALAIGTLFIGGKDDVEGRVYEPYKDVA